MRIGAGHAEEKLVADGLADEGCAGVENPAHRGGRRIGLARGREPVRAAAAGAIARDVVHVLDRAGEPGERPGCGARDGGLKIMRHEGREGVRGKRHDRAQARCCCWAKYQSRIFAPFQATTASCSRMASSVRSTCAIRCGTPERYGCMAIAMIFARSADSP